jgi:acyl-CoA dehydrogenase
MHAAAQNLAEQASLASAASTFSIAVDTLQLTVRHVVDHYGTDARAVSVGAVPLLKLFGIVAGGWQLLRSAAIAAQRLAAPQTDAANADFYRAKIATARFYADHVLSQATGLAHSILYGGASALTDGVL